MGKLSTHVLDTMHGTPGAGVRIDLYAIDAGASILVIGRPVTGAEDPVTAIREIAGML